MKLLFDENLAPSLVLALADIFPQSEHAARIGLGAAPDREVWEYAREHHYTLVSKDSDFHELSLLFGLPSKVVWIRRGNCTTIDPARICLKFPFGLRYRSPFTLRYLRANGLQTSSGRINRQIGFILRHKLKDVRAANMESTYLVIF